MSAARAARPSNTWAFDLFVLVLAGGVAVASVVLDTNTEVVTLFGYEVPPLCTWRNLMGMECMGCGLTRSFVFMGHLKLADAFQLHVLGPVLYVFVTAQVPYRLLQLARHLRFRRQVPE